MFLASENIDFTGLVRVFLLGGGEHPVSFPERKERTLPRPRRAQSRGRGEAAASAKSKKNVGAKRLHLPKAKNVGAKRTLLRRRGRGDWI